MRSLERSGKTSIYLIVTAVIVTAVVTALALVTCGCSTDVSKSPEEMPKPSGMFTLLGQTCSGLCSPDDFYVYRVTIGSKRSIVAVTVGGGIARLE